MARTERIKCDKCKKPQDEVYGRGYYGGNKDEGFYCLKCYKKRFKIDFYDDIPERVIEKMKEEES